MNLATPPRRPPQLRPDAAPFSPSFLLLATTTTGSPANLPLHFRKVITDDDDDGVHHSFSPANSVTPEGQQPQRSRAWSAPADVLQRPSLYKTELCRSFLESGCCRYGSKCQFAHGESELRPVARHPRWKTEICKTFHTLGTCRYGTRCRFIHLKPGETLDDESCREQGENARNGRQRSESCSERSSEAVVPPVGEPARRPRTGSRLAVFRDITETDDAGSAQ